MEVINRETAKRETRMLSLNAGIVQIMKRASNHRVKAGKRFEFQTLLFICAALLLSPLCFPRLLFELNDT